MLDGAAGTYIQGFELGRGRAIAVSVFRAAIAMCAAIMICSTSPTPRSSARCIRAYLEAGADIVQTNTFSATTIAQADYSLENVVYELNVEGARLAREAADEISDDPINAPRFVAGSIGPTNRTASISPDVNDPAKRNVTYEELVITYKQATQGLLDGGADTILIETIFDTLNAKAAIYAVRELFDELGYEVPIMLSVTITDQSGRTLSGQTTEAFYNAVAHAKPLSVGLNCALGPALMRPYVAELSRIANCYVSAYPNAGLPNAFGEYDETPEMMTAHVGEWAEAGLLNIVGGCCGTLPPHIRAFADHMVGIAPRKIKEPPTAMRLSGLEPFTLTS